MNHYLITIAYDGSRYYGWQRLKNQPKTIQGILENSLSNYMSEKIHIHGSGRTDAGVSAIAQTADFLCSYNIENEADDSDTSETSEMSFLNAVNKTLPGDIQITSIRLLDNSIPAQKHFNARKSAVEKHYRYTISLSSKTNPFNHKHIYNMIDAPINLNYKRDFDYAYIDDDNMKQCVSYLCGVHDFSAFTTDKNPEKSHIRTLNKIEISYIYSIYPALQFDFYGEGFLYNMVRILSGTLLLAGLGKIKAAQIPDIIASKKRKYAGPTLPSNGLTLVSVKYDL